MYANEPWLPQQQRPPLTNYSTCMRRGQGQSDLKTMTSSYQLMGICYVHIYLRFGPEAVVSRAVLCDQCHTITIQVKVFITLVISIYIFIALNNGM